MSRQELRDCLEAVPDRSWSRQHGALVHELLPPASYDLRLVVAGARVAGAPNVSPAPSRRTNVSLGGELRAAQPDATVCALAVVAASAIGADP
jgi:glutathione synthase/RimK-type ligase-like ATP-grasp enzyme